MNLRLALDEVVHAAPVAVAEVVDAPAERAEELLVAALERAEVRRIAEVPLAGQRGGVAGVPEERRQGGVAGRQPEVGAVARRAGDGLLGGAAQAVLIPAGDQGEAGRRAHRRVRVAVGEAQALGGHPVETGGDRRARAVAADVGVAHVVGHDEDEARRHEAPTPERRTADRSWPPPNRVDRRRTSYPTIATSGTAVDGQPASAIEWKRLRNATIPEAGGG